MMKPVLCAVSAFLMLSFASTAVLAYSGSECEVNDCSVKSSKGASSAAKEQPTRLKTKAEIKADVKNEAKTEAKNQVMDKAPAPLRELGSFLK